MRARRRLGLRYPTITVATCCLCDA